MDEQILNVRRSGEFYYPICFEEGFDRLSEKLREEGLAGQNFCIVTDSHVAPLYANEVQRCLMQVSPNVAIFVFEAGEKNKNLDTIQKLYRFLVESGADRKSVIAALGGGVAGDMAGFGSATFLRGIDFIQIPTTLLAQVDSSVGGKTGVDLDQYKNMVGAFHQPRLVYMNMKTLKSLPETEFACGMGEVLKTGLITDGDFFRSVSEDHEEIRSLNPEKLSQMIRRCCEIKAGIVERDPKEQGERALLNLGHTIGHAVEKLMDFRLLHGQCVGLGLVAAAYISLGRGLLKHEEYQEIRQALSLYGLPLSVEGLRAEDILAATRKDKKMEQGKVKFILMKGIGKSYIDRTVSDEEILSGIGEILQ